MTIDPVCGMSVDEKTAGKNKSEFNGKPYYFCSDRCKRQFDKSPEQYAQKTAGGGGSR